MRHYLTRVFQKLARIKESQEYRPRRRSDVEYCSGCPINADGCLVEGDGNQHGINGVGGYIWLLCNGDLTRHEIAEKVTDVYAVGSKRATSDTYEIVRTFRGFGLLEREPLLKRVVQKIFR